MTIGPAAFCDSPPSSSKPDCYPVHFRFKQTPSSPPPPPPLARAAQPLSLNTQLPRQPSAHATAPGPFIKAFPSSNTYRLALLSVRHEPPPCRFRRVQSRPRSRLHVRGVPAGTAASVGRAAPVHPPRVPAPAPAIACRRDQRPVGGQNACPLCRGAVCGDAACARVAEFSRRHVACRRGHGTSSSYSRFC